MTSRKVGDSSKEDEANGINMYVDLNNEKIVEEDSKK
jgi:hypothetical protein